MPKNVSTKFTVEGRGPFPIDMLRYDAAHPYQTQDAFAIADSFDTSDGYKPWEVQLITAQWNGPTSARWASFMCRVTKEERY
jgi:hypothetical protein